MTDLCKTCAKKENVSTSFCRCLVTGDNVHTCRIFLCKEHETEEERLTVDAYCGFRADKTLLRRVGNEN